MSFAFEANRLSWKLQRRLYGLKDVDFVSQLLGLKSQSVHENLESYRRELQDFDALRKLCGKSGNPLEVDWGFEKAISSGNSWLPTFYAIVRMTKPKVVIETGCASGFTSAVILYALAHNGDGHLVTVDLPAYEGQGTWNYTLPSDLLPGFLVPQSFKDRWTLRLGNSRDLLPEILHSPEFRSVDVFYHDSDHSYTHMIWEYSTIWPHLGDGGVLMSDDIGWNTAFRDFAQHVEGHNVIHACGHNFGAIRR